MDYETLQALIEVYKGRASTDLLSIIIAEAEAVQGARRCSICCARFRPDAFRGKLRAGAPPGLPILPQCRRIRAGRAAGPRLGSARGPGYAGASAARPWPGAGGNFALPPGHAQDPAMRNRDLERVLGVRPGTDYSQPAKIIPLTNYSARRENNRQHERLDLVPETFLRISDDAAVTFGDVAGLSDIKNEIRRRIVLPYLKPTLFERYRQKPGGSLLLYGPPGCGKTLIARATAGESDARFLSVGPEEIIDKYAGDAEKRLRVFFDEARAEPPAILFFDDFELLAYKRDSSYNDAAPALIAAFLSELDSTLRDNSGVLVIAATNAPWTVDPALFRVRAVPAHDLHPAAASRCTDQDLSDAIAGVPGADKAAVDRIARKTAGYSGADLRALAVWANTTALGKALNWQGAEVPVTKSCPTKVRAFARSTLSWIAQARVMLRPLEGDDFFTRLLPRFSAPSPRSAGFDAAVVRMQRTEHSADFRP